MSEEAVFVVVMMTEKEIANMSDPISVLEQRVADNMKRAVAEIKRKRNGHVTQ